VKSTGKKKIHVDKNGREFIKEIYFIGGKMKFRRIYVIDGMPENEFYEKNATDLDFYLNEDYQLMNAQSDATKQSNVKIKSDLPDDDDLNDLPF
jgi:hypothetical protein